MPGKMKSSDEKGTSMTTTLKERLVERMFELAAQGTWKPVPSDHAMTARFTETVPTPEANRGSGFGRWHHPTYERHLFVTYVAGKFILGEAPAPWVGRRDRDVPLWFVELILNADEPWTVAENWLELKHARRAGIRGDGVRGYR